MVWGKKRPKAANDSAEPTPEQIERGTWQRTLRTYRRVPVIQTLWEQGKLSDRQYKALAHYATKVEETERSPSRDSLDPSPKGGGNGMPPFSIRAELERAELESALGGLRDIAFAMTFRDLSLSQWAMERGGAVERRRINKGGTVVTWFEPSRGSLKIAALEIKFAGERLAAAIAA